MTRVDFADLVYGCALRGKTSRLIEVAIRVTKRDKYARRAGMGLCDDEMMKHSSSLRAPLVISNAHTSWENNTFTHS